MLFTPDLRSIYEKDLINNVVRRGEADLVALITREQNFQNSLNLVLSDYLKLGDEKKYFKGCFDFFVCRAKQFHVFLSNSPTFIKTANEFLINIINIPINKHFLSSIKKNNVLINSNSAI